MGKSAPSAPAAPDPVTTANAQTASNKDTALYNFGLNNPNWNTPLGSLNYTISNSTPSYDNAAYDKAYGDWKLASDAYTQQQLAGNRGEGGKGRNSEGGNTPYGVAAPTLEQFKIAGSNPQSSAQVKLSPEQQQLYDLQSGQSIDLAKLATALQGNVGKSLSQPTPGSADFDTASKNASDAYYKSQTQYLDPQFQQEQQRIDAKLANQGITLGSEAYNNEQGNFARTKQSAYDSARNNAIQYGPQNAQQLFSLATAARQQPLNEFNALRSQSQVQMPTFQGMNPSSAQPTNVMQAYQNKYQGDMNNYNQQVASNNNTTSGLFGLGGSLGAAMLMSDRRLKTNIERIGQTKGGVPVYRFKYKGADKKYIGVMSDEARHIPGAVVRMSSGFDAVDYSRIH